MRKASLVFGLLLGVALFVCPVHATTLADLVANPNLTVVSGDKVFDHFNSVQNPIVCGIPGFCAPADLSGIVVNPVVDAAGNLGVEFSGAIIVAGNPPFPNSLDIRFGYRVTSTGGAITDIHMLFNGALFPAWPVGQFAVNVTETVTDLIGNPLANITVQDHVLPGSVAAGAVFLNPVQAALVQKDILLFVNANTIGSISFVDQTFSQVGVPEPASLVLIGTGLIGCALLSRRRKK